MPGPMPDPSSPQFIKWLQGYDPATQQAILRELGMEQASANPMSLQGGYAPEISPFAYDMPSMLGGIPMSTNSKGEPNPMNLEQLQKRLNYGQDITGSAGLGNNMLSWMTGGQGTDPSAWQPTRVGVGQPLQFTGESTISAYANSGSDDWQSFMADRISKGDTPAAAFTALKKVVQGTDETGGAPLASPGLLASLPASFDTNDVPGAEPPDIKTDRGFATVYDTKALMGFADDLFKGIAKDKAMQGTAFQDPKTGQWYQGYEDKKTEQMEAADKLGLAYPTQSYSDPDYIKAYQQKMLGSDDTYDAYDQGARESQAQDTLGTAQREAGNAQDYMVAAREAYERTLPRPAYNGPGEMAATRALSETPFGTGPASGMGAAVGGGLPPTARPTPDTMGPYVGSAPSYYSGDIITSPTPGAHVPGLNPRDPRAYAPNEFSSGVGEPLSPELLQRDPALLDAFTSGTGTPRAPDMLQRDPGTRKQGGSKAAAKPKTAADLGAGYALGSTRAPSRADYDAAIGRKTKANAAASDAQQAYYRSKFMTDDEMSRAQVAATMRYLAHKGRSPLQDQLAARSQTIRNLIGY